MSYMDASPVVERKGLVLDAHDQGNFGYLRVAADRATLTISFVPVTPNKTGGDTVTVDLASHSVRTPPARTAKRSVRNQPGHPAGHP